MIDLTPDEQMSSDAVAAATCGDDATIREFMARSPRHEQALREVIQKSEQIRRYAEKHGHEEEIYQDPEELLP